MSAPLKGLVVGLGRAGLEFDLASGPDAVYSHAKSLMRAKGAELAGGVDPDPGKRAAFQSFTGKPAFDSVASFAERAGAEIDLVCASTPTVVRETVLKEILASLKPRAILLEKPVAASLDEAVRVAEMLGRSGALVLVNYIRRFLPGFGRLRKEIASKKYGELQAGTIYYSTGLFNNASHFLNLLSFLFQDRLEPVWVGDSRPCSLKGDIDLPFCLGLGGAMIFFQAVDDAAFTMGEIDLVFSSGRVRLKDYAFYQDSWLSGPDPRYPDSPMLRPEHSDLLMIPEDYQARVVETIADVLTSGRDNPSDIDSAMQTMELCARIRERTTE